MSDATGNMLHVMAGVLCDTRGQVLLAQRPAGKHLAGFWEFPGGKLEPGESPAAALVRECGEELGVLVAPIRFVARAGDERIRLDVWLARLVAGEPAPGPDHDELTWTTAAGLVQLDWLPLDAALLPDVRKALHDVADGTGPGTALE